MIPEWVLWLSGIVVLFIFWFFWATRSKDFDKNTINCRLHRLWRRIAFWAGDVRVMREFPWVSTNVHHNLVTHEEFLEIQKKVLPGDVLLTTHHGFIFSNLAIPGCFKHAAIFIECSDGLSRMRLVEAISEGVVKRHPQYALADDMIILRPRHIRDIDREKIIINANKIVGCKYDTRFDFNIEDELTFINNSSTEKMTQEDAMELNRNKGNLKGFDLAFSCTEAVAFCLWHMRRRLGIVRKKARGKLCIIADQFINRDFKIVWTNVNPKRAKKRGLHEEGIREIERLF